jgi:hypothetical protein
VPATATDFADALVVSDVDRLASEDYAIVVACGASANDCASEIAGVAASATCLGRCLDATSSFQLNATMCSLLSALVRDQIRQLQLSHQRQRRRRSYLAKLI